MRRGTIYQNKWAGNRTYFVYMGAAHSRKGEARKVRGIGLTFLDTKDNESWKLEFDAEYYTDSLKDEENFPAVGYIDIAGILKEAILRQISPSFSAPGRCPLQTAGDPHDNLP